MTITEIFEYAVGSNASDLFLTAGKPPALRRYGAVAPCGEEIVPPEERAAAATDDLGDTGALPTVGDAQ